MEACYQGRHPRRRENQWEERRAQRRQRAVSSVTEPSVDYTCSNYNKADPELGCTAKAGAAIQSQTDYLVQDSMVFESEGQHQQHGQQQNNISTL